MSTSNSGKKKSGNSPFNYNEAHRTFKLAKSGIKTWEDYDLNTDKDLCEIINFWFFYRRIYPSLFPSNFEEIIESFLYYEEPIQSTTPLSKPLSALKSLKIERNR